MQPIIYDLQYFKDGEEENAKISVKFVPYRMVQLYSDMSSEVSQVAVAWENIKEYNDQIDNLKKEKPDGWKEKSDRIQALRSSDFKLIRDIAADDIVERRIDLIIELLKVNGERREYLLSTDFWMDCVDPTSIIEFLNFAVYKDMPKKKLKK